MNEIRQNIIAAPQLFIIYFTPLQPSPIPIPILT